MYYDAFISYKHCEKDAAVAKKLHHILENYHIPKRLRESSGKEKISRIFRDREELPVSADLGHDIEEALEHSEFLILICSPESRASEWVQREVSFFLKNHGIKDILTVLVGGEPEDVFPEVICYREEIIETEDGFKKVKVATEPLAADVRASSMRETMKKLQGESLRILAAMLHCSYDSLKQRHREQKMLRGVWISGAVAVLAVAFMGYALWQNSIVKRHFLQAKKNEAQYAAGVSEELLKLGDRLGALEEVLSVENPYNKNEPLVPEQLYALNNALYSYACPDYAQLHALRRNRMESYRNEDCEGSVSPDGAYFLSMDKKGIVYIYDTLTAECIWKIKNEELSEGENKYIYASFFEKNKAAFLGEKNIYVADIKNKKIEKKYPLKHSLSEYTLEACSLSGGKLVFSGTQGYNDEKKNWIYAMDLQSGKALYDKVMNGDDSLIISSVAINEEGSCIALGYRNYLYDTPDTEQGIDVISIKDRKLKHLSGEFVGKLAFHGEDELLALHFYYPDGINDDNEVQSRNYYAAAYRISDGKQTWKSEEKHIFSIDFDTGILCSDPADHKGDCILAYYIGDTLVICDWDAKKIISKKDYPDNITGIEVFDGSRLILGLADGTIYLHPLEQSDYLVKIGDTGKNKRNFFYSGAIRDEEGNPTGINTVMQIDDKKNICFSSNLYDEDLRASKKKQDERIYSVKYFTVGDVPEEATYRLDEYWGGYTVYDSESGQALLDYKEKDGNHYHEAVIFRWKGKDYIGFNEYVSSDNAEETGDYLVVVDLDSGEEMLRENMYLLSKQYDDIAFSDDIGRMVLFDGDGFSLAGLAEESGNASEPSFHLTVEDQMQLIPEKVRIDSLEFLPNQDYLAITAYDSDEFSNRKVYLWNIKSSQWIRGEDGYALAENHEYQAFDVTCGHSKSHPVIAVSSDQEIRMIDCTDGHIISRIPADGYDNYIYAFLKQDSRLLVCGDGRELSLWDVASGTCIMRQDGNTGSNDWDITDLITDNDSDYFLGYSGVYGITSRNEMYKPKTHVFFVDEGSGFYQYADIPSGFANLKAGEILIDGSGNNYYRGHLYTYPELKKKAEKILGR